MRKMFVLFACFLLCSVGSASAVTLSLNPSNVTVNVGDTFNITLDAQLSDNLAQPGAISAWDVDVLYNPSQMVFVNYSLGGWLGNSIDLSLGDIGGGLVDLAEVSLEDPQDLIGTQPDPFLLATLQFECLTAGNSQILLTLQNVGDEIGDPINAHVGAPVSVTQTQVPEPSTFMLIVTGLLGFGVLRRRF
jgi:hypothetical protein